MDIDQIIGKPKTELDTPCLVIDKLLLEYNLTKMQALTDLQKKHLRPHVKTHKCSKLCQLQIRTGAIGISACKVSEAEVLTSHDIKGILITSPIVTKNKIERLLRCVKRSKNLTVVIDEAQNAQNLNAEAQRIGLTLNVLVDIDSGIGRTGVAYEKALEFGQLLHELPFLNLKGIQCYAGNLQHITDYEERKKVSLEVMNKAAEVARSFIANDLPCEIVTGSGTGTYDIDVTVEEVTEIQPGSYTVMDQEYAVIGSKEHSNSFEVFKPSMTLLTTVISANHYSHVTVDAGTKSLYINPIPPKIIYPTGLQYDWAEYGDEHGKITSIAKYDVLPKLGSIVELIVSHCDPTINLFNYFHITENQKVVDIWPIDMRGKSQ